MKGSRAFRRVQLPMALIQRHSQERERSHLTNLYATLSQANQAMLRAVSEAELFQEICRICVEFGHFGLAWIAVQKEGRPSVVGAAGPMQGYLEGLEISLDPEHPAGRVFRGEGQVVSENWATDPRMAPWQERGARFHIRSSGSFPVRTQTGVEAVLTLYSDRDGAFEPDKLDLLEELTSDMAFAMDKFRVERQRRVVEATLWEEKRLYQDLVKSLPAGIYRLRVGPVAPVHSEEWETIYRSQYAIEFVSDRFCELLGLDREALKESPGSILDRVHPDDRAEFSARNAEALTGRRPFRWEGRLAGVDSPHWIRLESFPRILPDGGTLWTGVLTDITERRSANNDYRRLHSLLRQAESIAKVGGWEIDLEASTLYWSEEVFRIHELDPRSNTPTVEGAIRLYAPEWQSVVADRLQKSIQTGEAFDFEAEIITAQARRIWVKVTGRSLRQDGQVARVVGVIQDISDRKRSETKVAEALAHARRFSTALDQIPSFIYLKDRQHRYVYANQPTLDLFGCTAEELVGSDDSRFFRLIGC